MRGSLLRVVQGLAILAAMTAEGQMIPGNLAVLRVGDGTQGLTSLGNSIFVDQYTTAGKLVGTVAIPDTSATNNSLILSGVAGSEGGLTRSSDRSVLAFCGYHFVRGGALAPLSQYAGTAVPRGSATINAAGAYSLALASGTMFSQNNPRCAASSNGTNFWAAGGNSGTLFMTPTVQPVTVQSNLADTRQILIVSSNLYFSVQAGTPGLYTLGQAGHPATPAGLTTNASTTNLVFATGTGSLPSAFDLSPALNLAYVADMRAQTAGGGVQKWTNNAGAWKLLYTIGIGNPLFGVFGLTVDFSGTNTIIYATTTEGNAAGDVTTNRLIRIVDTGSSSVPATLATAPANTEFRGVALTPDLRPEVLTTAGNETLTNGATLVLTAAYASIYPVTFQWLLNGAPLPGATNATLTLTNVGPSANGEYDVAAGNHYGAVTSLVENLTVTATPIPPSVTSQPQGETVYAGESAGFSITAAGSPPLTYQWLSNGVALAGQTNPALVFNQAATNDSASYSVTVSNFIGQTNSLAAVLAVQPLPAPSFIPYTLPGLVYIQDFDSLPGAGSVAVNATNPVTVDGVTYALSNPFDFAFPVLDSASGETGGLGLAATMEGWYGFGASGSKFGASAGDESTGGIISFGLTNSAATNRALGVLATSSTGPVAFGVKFVNQTTNILTQITLQFTGELWRQQTNTKTLQFGYLLDPSATNRFSTNTTAWLTNLTLAFSAGASNAVNGTAITNQQILGASAQTISNWTPGAALWLVWQMTNSAANGQGLAIDDFSFSASTGAEASPPVLSVQRVAGGVVLSWPLSATGFTLQQSTNLIVAGAWSAVSQAVVVSGGSNTVTVPVAGPALFFRLAR